jgi:two-component system phosphate regulon sensor histidine kinase PhoR
LVRRSDAAVVLQNSAASSILSQEDWNSTPIEEHAERFGFTGPDGTPLSPQQLPILRALREGTTVTDYEMKMHDNEHFGKDLLVSAAPLLDERGRVTSAVLVMQDVTQMKKMDRRKDEFIATAAHEIRNPLAALSGYQQLLQRIVERASAAQGAQGTSPNLAKNVEAIGKQVDRLNILVERLLDAQRIQLGRLVLHRSPVDIRELVATAVEHARTAAGASHQIVAVLPQEPVTGNYDAMRLEQVLSNLINNAVRYTPEGSRVEVRASTTAGFQAASEAHDSRTDDSHLHSTPTWLRVEVADQGPGVPPEKRAQLFNRYYQFEGDTTGNLSSNHPSTDGSQSGSPPDTPRSANKRRGLGLGLYISSEIVRAHGGHIGVVPNPEGGSIFWFTLPLDSSSIPTSNFQPSLPT